MAGRIDGVLGALPFANLRGVSVNDRQAGNYSDGRRYINGNEHQAQDLPPLEDPEEGGNGVPRQSYESAGRAPRSSSESGKSLGNDEHRPGGSQKSERETGARSPVAQISARSIDEASRSATPPASGNHELGSESFIWIDEHVASEREASPSSRV